MVNYLVVLFKNKKRKRIIKEFITLKKAKEFFNKKLSESNNVEFEVVLENGNDCTYELGIVELSNKQLVPVYITDEFGRNLKVKLEDDGMTLFEISKYKKPESIYDLQQKRKISFEDFIKVYLRGDEVRLVSSLNNKIVVQKDDEFFLFSLKNQNESKRFLDCLNNFYVRMKKSNCLFVKDISKPQRKYLIQLLNDKGFDKKVLYRQTTTHPRQE